MDAETKGRFLEEESMEASDLFFDLITGRVIYHRPKFKGPADVGVEWFERETHVKDKLEWVARCFTCGCSARLEVSADAGITLSLDRCARQMRCTPAPAITLDMEFMRKNENRSQ